MAQTKPRGVEPPQRDIQERASRPPLAVAGMLDPCVTVLSLAHSAPDRLCHTTSAMQTNLTSSPS
ncbi:hypothetical protein [Streptomyces sp. NPDC017520]|uniref:hypothetical protein n=1 Tax=Streptomyces sp. NPDC017520 TaxID=3364998 RepID=UPI0037BDF437